MVFFLAEISVCIDYYLATLMYILFNFLKSNIIISSVIEDFNA